MSNYEYNIALSFAGEQRLQVEQVAELLKQQGISVFYDNYELATLWGKDLYQHLAKVYSQKARFCIIFASKEYAEKSWTNHELKNAQERAFQEKGQEYILPVRFDSTPIPGIPTTTGYLDFNVHGAEGIANLAIEKLRTDGDKTVSYGVREPEPLSCSASPRALISCSSANIEIRPIIVDSEWGNQIWLSFKAESREEEAIFSRLGSVTDSFVVAFRFQVATARIYTVTSVSMGGRPTYNVRFTIEKQSFDNQYEAGMGSLTVESLAKMRAERILLNQHVHEAHGDSSVLAQASQAMVEVGIRGINTLVHVEASKFPFIWRMLKNEPQVFLDLCWITAVAELKLSSTVEHISKLVLVLRGHELSVEFSGIRHRKYINANAPQIEVRGILDLEGQVAPA